MHFCNSVFLYLCIFVLIQLSHSSLLSRIKNPHFYSTPHDIIIPTRDYQDEEFMLIPSPYPLVGTAFTDDSLNIEEGRPLFTRKHNKMDIQQMAYRPTKGSSKKIQRFRPTEEYVQPHYEAPQNHNEFGERRTLSDKLLSFIFTKTTHESSELTRTKQLFSYSMTWRPYFPRRSSINFDILYRNPDLIHGNINAIAAFTKDFHLDARNRSAALTLIDSEEAAFFADTEPSKQVTRRQKKIYVLKKLVLKPIFRHFPKSDITRVEHKAHKLSKLANRRSKRTNRCYTCGLNETGLSTTMCHQIFEGEDERLKMLHHHYKTKCEGTNFTGGCFKRYLDVGDAYNERGCRKKPPIMGKSYVSKRLMTLEILLHKKDDGCVASPHAVLTPFSRPISLFARYHVCVCSGRYCNAGRHIHVSRAVEVVIVFVWFLLR